MALRAQSRLGRLAVLVTFVDMLLKFIHEMPSLVQDPLTLELDFSHTHKLARICLCFWRSDKTGHLKKEELRVCGWRRAKRLILRSSFGVARLVLLRC